MSGWGTAARKVETQQDPARHECGGHNGRRGPHSRLLRPLSKRGYWASLPTWQRPQTATSQRHYDPARPSWERRPA